jgi:branched-chain amino acid transport system ATP-binding protein
MTLLSVHKLSAFYGDFQALFGVSLDVAEGETVAVIGANGAGKSTFLRAVAGQTKAMPDSSVVMDGVDITHRPPHEIVETGIALVP